MEQKEFIKEHPSLEGSITFSDGYGNGVNNKKGYIEYVEIDHIHKTQLDKQKVRTELNDNPLFSDRIKIVEEFKKWAKENKVEESSFNLVTWFDSKIRNYLLKGLGL